MADPRKTPDTPSPDTLLDVSAPSVSGTYIKLAEEGKLDELVTLQDKRVQLHQDLAIVKLSLRNVNDPLWLLNFYVKSKPRGRFAAKLKKYVAKLEERKAKRTADVTEVEKRIYRIEPRILDIPLPESKLLAAGPDFRISEDRFVLLRSKPESGAADAGSTSMKRLQAR